jgi:hypothetical protein
MDSGTRVGTWKQIPTKERRATLGPVGAIHPSSTIHEDGSQSVGFSESAGSPVQAFTG